MYTLPTINTLDTRQEIYVLRNARGESLGTGPREALEVLRYIVGQTERSARRDDFAPRSVRSYLSADVRSAIMF